MALFGRRKGRPRVARFLGDEEADALHRDLTGEQFEMTQAALEAASPLDRAMLTQLLAEEYFGSLAALGRWVDAEGSSPVPLTFRGTHHIILGWRARGDGTSETVSERGWGRFFEHLEAAEQDLRRAAALEPADPTPWSFLVLSGRGLQVGTQELRRRWDEVESRHPRHRHAANHMIQGLAAKWGGSHEEMFAFARAQHSAAPEGDPIHALIAEAHLERWLGFALDDDPEGRRAYLSDPAVRAELRAAAERSVASPAWSGYRWQAMDRNFFAMALGLGGDRTACDQFRALDGVVADHPWGYLGDPSRAFERTRRQLCG